MVDGIGEGDTLNTTAEGVVVVRTMAELEQALRERPDRPIVLGAVFLRPDDPECGT